ncbi:MAG TPA: hypothetical protein DEB30_03130 [Candidatus Peribacter riflensis]|uniref:Uncharacterized protein n=1 Tax=Candidatus Peribacter riflensis TaxID=1735162 RepID=A0A0S1STS4_9BACT|nr:MAG: hypothetical protein PeribacterA2_0639 [Candidatus Peribacter riflensis]OGJ78968.1 MAG: hypothetical protein A2398_04665 [Candidatus Peribacteria bacterium RIFOXYB1_FULL_57_12]OGJ80638.1 MAG: hypothetical protein A2412_04900 [Candidatus Peribacteria bacterium RIFOXYC1_FULL_58_8]ALM11111.1 MAG: hypothetical protein PeribacterB2_0639 [Candidatus Peribacter riflensis]ALM12214.1 MAG: hypothetical protein PeribacterC2_0639 [Candidatus Peribacter riflensis]
MKAPQEFAENERKRGEPGYVEVFAQERTLTHRIIRPDRVTDQGFGIYGEEAPLEQPVAHTDFVGTAKFYNTHYEPDVIGQRIGGLSLPGFVHNLRTLQKKTGVTDDRRYTYAYVEPTEPQYWIEGNGMRGTIRARPLTDAEIQQFQSLLRGGDTVEDKLALTKEALRERVEQLLGLKPRIVRTIRSARDRVAGWLKGSRK